MDADRSRVDASTAEPVRSLPDTGHEHHARILPHVDELARLAASIGASTLPDGFGRWFDGEYRFLVGTLVPHIEATEAALYDELERLMEGRHSMAPMRREHDELRRIVAGLGTYRAAVGDGSLGQAETLGLRRALFRLHSLLRVHLAEEELYLGVLDRNLSPEEKDVLARGLDHAIAEPL